MALVHDLVHESLTDSPYMGRIARMFFRTASESLIISRVPEAIRKHGT